ncbi:uncharacterized protein LOC116999793 [Catharus ustulatus]|uniref:uncharacterized protein LOC116999793 n=1 Tax=Catharus ustulatus TaxID=91951 RepID=UPI00140CF020|nr:uncharacterized protein LOC116999793 [Catharus ustulatus]
MATKSAKHLKVWGTILQLLKRGMEEKETMWAARKALGLDCQGRLPFTEEQETQVEKGELEIEPKQEGSDSEILTAQEEKGEEKQVQEEIMARVCLTCGIMKPMSEGSCLGCIKKAYPVTGKRLNPPQYPWDDLREAERKARSTQPAPSPAPLPSAPPQFVDPEEWLPGLAMKAPEDPLEMAAEIASPEAGRGADRQRWREREVLRPGKGNQWRAPDKHPDIAEEVEELSEQLAAAWGTEEGGDAAAVGSRKPGREPGRLGGTSRAGKAQVNDHKVQMNLQQLQQLVNEITAEVEPTAPWTRIQQGPTETFTNFVDRLSVAVENAANLPAASKTAILIDCMKQQANAPTRRILATAPREAGVADLVKHVANVQRHEDLTQTAALLARAQPLTCFGCGNEGMAKRMGFDYTGTWVCSRGT